MAKRNRYREFDSLMTKIILGVAVFFVLYLVFAGIEKLQAVKVIMAILSIVGSLGCCAWLFLVGEFTKRRSLWMVTALVGMLFLTVLSLVLGYPCPPL